MKLSNIAVLSGRSQSAVDELRQSISGGIVLPSEASYEAARRVWNGAVTHRPAIIAFCQNTADVENAVRFARRHDLPLSVRGGSHDCVGRSVRHDGLVIDLTRMRQVVVDPHLRIATVTGGATVKDVATAAAKHDFVAALGNCGTVGMAGLTLGGGYLPLIGAHGLALDNLLGAEVVLADGQRVNTDAESEPELFWAIRGGGGNFGVITSLRIRLHQVNCLLAGPIFYPWSEAENVLCRYAALIKTAPEELGMLVGLVSIPDGQPVVSLTALWNGDEQRGKKIAGDLQSLAQPQHAEFGPSTYADMLAPIDGVIEATEGFHWEVRTRSLQALTADAIRALIAGAERKTSPHTMILVHPFHGAAARVDPKATAFGLRCEHFMVEIIACWEPNENDGPKHRQWTEDVWQSLAPSSLPGGYANLLRPEDHEQIADAYGGNAARLRDLKRQFDPNNVFASTIPLPDAV